MIENNKQVNINYKLRHKDIQGELIESTYDAKPLSFVYGKGNMIPKFEENIASLSEGDHFDFSIKSVDAYGEIKPDAILELDVNIFESNGSIDHEMLKVGNSIPMQDSNGGRMDGIVISVSDTHVKMDFNHPLAGKDLHFEGEVLAITEPVMEMAHEHGEEGCGCGSGCGC